MRKLSLPIDRIRDLAYSPDGRYLVVLGAYELSFVDLATFEERFTLSLDEDGRGALRLGGPYAALGRGVYDLRPTWAALDAGAIRAPRRPVIEVLEADSREALVAVSADGRVAVFVDTEDFADEDALSFGDTEGLAYDPFGEGRAPVWLDVWDVKREVRLRRSPLASAFADERPRQLGNLPVSADGRWAALWSGEELAVLDLERGSTRASFHHDAEVQRAVFSPDGRTLAALAGPSLWLWDVVGHLSVRRTPTQGPCSVLAFHPDGRQVGVVDGTGAYLFDTRALRETAAFDWGIRQPRALAFSPDGSTAAVANRTNEVVLWDLD